ncbi:MAG: M3 family oligoendopeptidase [bacterium]|nr:M3 family oligoendopeptidase [bacterium]
MEQDREKVKQKVQSFVKKRKNNTQRKQDISLFIQAINEFETIRAGDILKANAHLSFASFTDMENKELTAQLKQRQQKSKDIVNQLQFFELEIAKIDKDFQTQILQSPKTQGYHHYLQKIFDTAQYDLSEAEEKVISNLQKTSYDNRVDMLELFLSKEAAEIQDEQGQKTQKTFTELLSLCKDISLSIRTQAGAHVHKILKKYQEIAEQEINSVLAYKQEIDAMRKYPAPDTSRHLADDIASETVDQLIKIVAKHFNISTDFYQLKAQLLGQKQLAYHERMLPIGEIKTKFDFETSVDIVMQSFRQLDPEFAKIFENFLTQ